MVELTGARCDARTAARRMHSLILYRAWRCVLQFIRRKQAVGHAVSVGPDGDTVERRAIVTQPVDEAVDSGGGCRFDGSA